MTERDAIEREAEARVVAWLRAAQPALRRDATWWQYVRARAWIVFAATFCLPALCRVFFNAVANEIARREHLRGGGE